MSSARRPRACLKASCGLVRCQGRFSTGFIDPKESEAQQALNRGRPAQQTVSPSIPPWTFDLSPEEDDVPYFQPHLSGPIYTKQLAIDKRCYGIPFKVDDAAALDAAMRHHQCAVRPVRVERLLLPFWIAATSVTGTFRADVVQRDPMGYSNVTTATIQSPDYNFVYPFGEHMYFNQVSASYVVSNSVAEATLCGSHIPSMLIDRPELLEEILEMPNPPQTVPFEMTTETALGILSKTNNKKRVQFFAYKELEKYHGKNIRASMTFWKLEAEAVSIRPVYLPLYRLGISTAYNAKPVPTYICGATGKASGPVVHVPKRFRMWSGVGTGTVGGAISYIAFTPELCAALGVASAFGIQYAITWFRYAEVLKQLSVDASEMLTMRKLHARSNRLGYKWTVEEEERAQYEYREELRAKARRRADFSERVREETEREEAMKAGRAWKAQRSRQSSRGLSSKADPDPLSYYRILGLNGKEGSATKAEIARSFRAEAAKHHPDLCPEPERADAHHRMQRILEAYNVLRDTRLREEYDNGQFGHQKAEA